MSIKEIQAFSAQTKADPSLGEKLKACEKVREMIGLAKEHETIIFSDKRAPLNLPLNHPGLNLIQRLRDEAHRFANTYNADLRSKKIRESVLDDFPGLGPVRRAALMARFGDIDRLRAASVEQLGEVEGFGPVLARELFDFLRR